MTGEDMAFDATTAQVETDTAQRLAAPFDAHTRRLYSLASRMCRTRDDARDCVQETFLRAARHPGSIPEGPGSEEAWLGRVLINTSRDGWRRQAVRRQAQVEPERNDPGHEDAVIARSLVHMALD